MSSSYIVFSFFILIQKLIQEVISKRAQENVVKRDIEHKRYEFNLFYLQKWAAEGHVKKEQLERDELAEAERVRIAAEEKAELDERNERREYERKVLADDVAETQKIQGMMRKTGVIAGVNAPLPQPSNIHARDMPRGGMKNSKLISSSDSAINSEAKNVSDWDKHKVLFSSLGLKKAPPPISRKTRYLVVTLKGSVDFTLNPKVKGRMPWHNAGGADATMTVFDEDLSLYRDLEHLKCENIGERGALCLAAEFVRGACPAIQILNLNRCEMQTRGCNRLLTAIRLARLDNLHTLKLRSNSLSARVVDFFHSALDKGALSNLSTLDLRDNELGLDGAYAVTELFLSGAPKSLRILRLENNNFGNEGFAQIVNVLRSVKEVKCPLIAAIYLGNNNVSPEVVDQYAPYPPFLIV